MAVEIYLSLYDRAYMSQTEDIDEHMTPDMIKKRKKRQLKEQAKKKQLGKGASQEVGKNEASISEDKELDKFEPNTLASTSDPLGEAMKFLTNLQNFAMRRIQTHTLAYELYKRKQKFLLMAQAIKRGMKIDPESPAVHTCIIDFVLQISSLSEQDNSLVTKILTMEKSTMLAGADPFTYTSEYLNKHQFSLPHIVAGIQSMHQLQPDNLEQNLENLTALDDDLEGISLEICIKVCKLLESKTFGQCSSQLKEYKEKCKSFYPLAAYFTPSPPLATVNGETAQSITTGEV